METANLPDNVLSEDNNSNISSSVYLGNLTPDKKNTNNSLSCRICHEDVTAGELIDPCECSGSLRLVHTNCLEKWLSISNTDRCEICKYAFSIKKKDKPIHQWWKARNVYGSKGIAADFICLIVLTPLCSVASYLCGLGATTNKRLGIWESIGLIILSCMLMATYFLWLFITVRFHFKSWRHWCNRNQIVKILIKHRDEDEKHESMKMKQAEENQLIVMNQLFAPFAFYRRFDPLYNLEQQTSYV